jgi:hypothetical protein
MCNKENFNCMSFVGYFSQLHPMCNKKNLNCSSCATWKILIVLMCQCFCDNSWLVKYQPSGTWCFNVVFLWNMVVTLKALNCIRPSLFLVNLAFYFWFLFDFQTLSCWQEVAHLYIGTSRVIENLKDTTFIITCWIILPCMF